MDADAHEQLVWLSVSLILLGVAQIISPPFALLPLPSLSAEWASSSTWLTEWVSYSYLGSVFAAFGAILCLLIGLLRHEVIQLEIILNRTLIYVILSLFVIGIYITVVGFLSLIFQSGGSLVFSLIATGLVAVLFQPLRAWAQRFVDRLLYGDREQPYALLAQLGQELENILAPQDILQQAADRVRVALKLPYTAVALRFAGQEKSKIVASSGIPAASPLILPLIVQHEQIGQFILAPRGPGESFTAADRRFLADLAGQVAIAAHTVTLMAELQRAREQLVYAREEEHLRLRRDLHDGLGTNLAALNLQVGQVRKLINAKPAQADAALLELRVQLRHMIAEVRGLINDLRPKALDEFGLVSALEVLIADVSAASGLHIRADLPPALAPLPAAVEVAAFRIIQESLTNVIRHAAAQNCAIRLTADHALNIEVLDDGLGLPEYVAAGRGLGTIRERAVELGGSCTAATRPEGGTRIFVILPLRSFDDDDS